MTARTEAQRLALRANLAAEAATANKALLTALLDQGYPAEKMRALVFATAVTEGVAREATRLAGGRPQLRAIKGGRVDRGGAA